MAEEVAPADFLRCLGLAWGRFYLFQHRGKNAPPPPSPPLVRPGPRPAPVDCMERRRLAKAAKIVEELTVSLVVPGPGTDPVVADTIQAAEAVETPTVNEAGAAAEDNGPTWL